MDLEKYRPLFIGGEWVDPVKGETQDDLNPATGEAIAKVAVADKEDIDRAVAAAQKAYDEVWFDTPPKERAGMLLKLADALDAHADEFARLESIDVGKPITLSKGDIPFVSDNLRFFAGAARCQEGKATGEYERGFTSMIRREPLGVVAGICPWNYPLMMAIWKIGPALAAGNTSIIKPAQITPLTTLYLAELAAEILPPGVFNVVTGKGAVIGDAITRHPAVRLVSVTGDTATGKLIAAACAETVKRAHLELGGKAPVVVFDDADVEALVETLKFAGYANTGQDCTASCRVVAGPKIYDELLSALVPAVESIKVGDTTDPDVEMGPLVSARQRESVRGFVERAEHAGGKVLTGGEETSPPSSPTSSKRPRSSSARSSGPSSPCSASATRNRPLPGPTTSTTALPLLCGQRTSQGPCVSPAVSSTGPCGSTRTFGSRPRCPMVATRKVATARTCRCTPSRTTPRSSM
jgi:betaine-aldehyde dehydrogenase/aminobutyraldehyde dehydrogenase